MCWCCLFSCVVTLGTIIHNPLRQWRRENGKIIKGGAHPDHAIVCPCVSILFFCFSRLRKNKHTLIILCIVGSNISERYGKWNEPVCCISLCSCTEIERDMAPIFGWRSLRCKEILNFAIKLQTISVQKGKKVHLQMDRTAVSLPLYLVVNRVIWLLSVKEWTRWFWKRQTTQSFVCFLFALSKITGYENKFKTCKLLCACATVK